MATVDRERFAAEQWFRRRGLPSIVRARQTQVVVRTVPAVVFLIVLEFVLDALSMIDGVSDDDFERLLQNYAYVLAYGALLVGLVVMPTVSAWLTARWVARRTTDGTSPRATTLALAIAGFYAVPWPIIGRLVGEVSDVVREMLTNAGLLLVILAVTATGGGSVLGWAVRAAIRQVRTLGTMTSRALPLFLLFTVFGFFTAEIWQASTASARYQIWSVAGLFAVVALVFMFTMLSDEVRQLTGSRLPVADLDKLRGSPFEAGADSRLGTDHVPLRPGERINMVLVLLLTQTFQALAFAMLTFLFFVVFGLLAVRPGVIKAWSGQEPSVGKLFGVQVPVANELLQVCIFLAAFSALYFVASATTDARYRQSFFDPLIDHMSVSLSARHVYLSRWG